MTPTRQMALTLLDMAQCHRDLSMHHATEPDAAEHHAREALSHEERAIALDPSVASSQHIRRVQDAQFAQTVAQDPFAAAMAAAGATEICIGRSEASQNGLKPAPRAVTLRATWPLAEPPREIAKPTRWPV